MTLYQLFALFIYSVFGKKWVLPVETHITGVDSRSHPGYELTYAYGTWASYIGAVGYVANDAMLIVLSILIISRLEITMYKISKIGIKKRQSDNIAKFNSQQEKLLWEIIKFSQITYEYLKLYSDWYFFIFLAYFFSGTIVLGLAFFHVTLDHFGNSIAVIPCFLFRHFILAYIGQKVTDKNNDLYRSLYFSKWYEIRDYKLQRTISIMLMRFQKQSGYSLGGFSVVCMLTYGEVMKNVYSFVAFIINMMK